MAVAKRQSTAKPRTGTAKEAATTSAAAAQTAPSQTAAESTETAQTAAVETPASAANATANGTKTTKSAAKPAAKTTKAEAEKPVQSSQKAEESGNRYSVIIPLDAALVGVAVKAASVPVAAAKKVAQNRNGIPAYVAVGSLAVLGAVEWPVAAVGGLSLAALRRWGPLKPAQAPAPAQEPQKSA